MTRKLLRSSVFVALAVGMAMPVRGHAQATQHFGSQTVVITGTSGQTYTAMASDSSGNLYISDENNSVVYKETLSGGTYTQSIIAVDGYTTSGGVKNPLGVAVDSNGNVYVCDLTNERVLKETPAGGGTYTQSVLMQNSGGSFVNPLALAVDSSGDVFVSAQSYNTSTSSYVYHVFEFTPAGGGTYTENTLAFAGLEDPSGLAVDSSNNLYIDDGGYPRVVKETLSGGTYTQSVVVDDSVFNWLDQSGYIAVDKNGDVFVVNGGPFGYDAETVVEALPIGGSYRYRLVGGGFGYGTNGKFTPTAVTTDSNGNLFVSDTLVNGTYQVQEISTPATNLGSVNVGSTSAVFTMPFTFSTATTYPQVGGATSEGASGEFVNTGTGTCDTNGTSMFYPAGSGCTVNVTFTPKYAGLRQGAVQVINTAGVMIAEQFITGTGIGPQVAFTPGTVSTFGTSLSSPMSVSVDGKGVVYVADGGSNNEIFTETPSGSSYTQALLGTNQAQQSLVNGVAVDGADNVSYDFAINGNYYEVVQCQPIIGSGCNGNFVADPGEGDGLAAPKGLAADGGGNIYIADTGNNRVVEVLFSSGSNYDQPSTWQINVATGLSSPAAVAVDGSGNVYIADTGNNRVLKETPSGGGFFTQSIVVNSGLNAPAGVAVDDIGNLFISDTGNQRVLKETVSGSTYTQSVALSSGLGSPQGLAVDASGNLYIADSANKVIVKLTMATGPSLTFATTAPGSTSSDSPQTVTFENIGTAALTLPIPGTGNNPAISANFSLNSTGTGACPLVTSTSSTAGTLAANTACTLPISFMPTTGGSISGSLILTDNNLNTAASTQTILLSGNGASSPAVSLLPNPVAFGNQMVGTTSSPSKVVVLMNTGSGTLSNIAVSVTGTNASAFGINSACGATLAGGASCNISVNFTPSTLGANTASLSVSDNATGSPQTVALTGTGTAPQATLNPNPLAFPSTLVGTAATALPMTLANPGTAALTITSISVTGTNASSFGQSNNCGSSLAAGSSCTITVTFTPGSTGSLSAAISVADNATGSPQSATLTGTGTAPQATLNPNPLAFPSTLVGTAATALPMTLSNPGTAALTITSISVTGTNASSFGQTNNCGSSLAAGSTCTITVTFTPGSAGSLSAAISVADNATGSPQSATLTGTGTAPQATLSPNPLAFPSTTVGVAATALPMTLSNPGTASLTITSISVTGTNASSFGETNNCGSSLAAGATCTITVSFTPGSAASLTAAISVADNATGSPQSATLTGTGTSPLVPQATLSPNPLAFPSTTMGTAATPLPMTLSNPGNGALTITSISVTGTNASSFGETNNCGSSLAAGATCTITVSFTPASAASFTAAISVVDNASGSPQSATITGTGSAGTYVVNTATPSGSVQPGATAQFNIAVQPLGGSFNNVVTLSATGLPAGAQYSFLPPSVTPGSSGANSVLSIQTPTGLSRLAAPGPRREDPVPLLALLAGLPLLGLAATRRRFRGASRRWMLLGLAALAVLPALALSGCSGGYFGPIPQTYTVTVVGTSGALQESTTISLTVQ